MPPCSAPRGRQKRRAQRVDQQDQLTRGEAELGAVAARGLPAADALGFRRDDEKNAELAKKYPAVIVVNRGA